MRGREGGMMEGHGLRYRPGRGGGGLKQGDRRDEGGYKKGTMG
jgi:hypothetical protein